MKSLLRRAVPARALVAVMLAVSGLAIVAQAAPANASPTCYGINCAGHDPNVYSCTVSSQVSKSYYSHQTPVVTLTNKYSIKCNANWSQAQLSQYAVNLGWNFMVVTFTNDGTNEFMCWNGPGSPNNTGRSVEDCPPGLPPFNDSFTSPAWTDMVYGAHITSSELDVYDAHGNPITTLQLTQ